MGFCRFLAFIVVFVMWSAPPPAAAVETLAVGGTGLSLGLARKLSEAYMEKHPDIAVRVFPSFGSSGGIRALLAGKLQVSFSARPLKAVEMQKGARAFGFTRSPFIFAVSNQVRGDLDLTPADVLRAYDRKLTTWPDGAAVRLVLREARETNTRKLEANFPGIGGILEAQRKQRGALIAYSDQESMDFGEKIIGAMTTTTLSAVLSEGRKLKPLSLGGVAPTPGTLASGAYPMSLKLWSVLGPDSGAAGERFLSFARSPDGVAVLRRYGALPLAADATE